MSYNTVIILFLLFLAVIISVFPDTAKKNHECINQNGVMVRGVYEFECVKRVKE